MSVDLVDALVILAHPMAGIAAAYFLYKQWSSIKSIRRKSNITKMSNEQKDEIMSKQIISKKQIKDK